MIVIGFEIVVVATASVGVGVIVEIIGRVGEGFPDRDQDREADGGDPDPDLDPRTTVTKGGVGDTIRVHDPTVDRDLSSGVKMGVMGIGIGADTMAMAMQGMVGMVGDPGVIL